MPELILDPSLAIYRGSVRQCYRHPEHPDRCVKISLPPTNEDLRKWRKRFRHNWMRWLPGTWRNVQEYRQVRKLERKMGDLFYAHAPQYYGLVQTDRGEGLIVELVRDANGAISDRLLDRLVKQPESRAEMDAMVDALEDFVLEHCVPLFDPDAKNIVVQELGDGTRRLVVIDWKGAYRNREAVPLSTYIPYFTRLKIKRRFARMRERMDQQIAAELEKRRTTHTQEAPR